MPAGGITCSVAICNSNTEKLKKCGQKLIFHTFPTGKIGKEWVRRCYRKDSFNPMDKNKRICSKHFKKEDYADVIEASIKNVLPRRLKPDAIPTLFLLPEKEHDVKGPSRRELREQYKEQKCLVDELLSSHSSVVSQSDIPLDIPVEDIASVPGTSSESDYEKLLRQFNSVVAENSVLKNELEGKQHEINDLKQKNNTLVSENATLQNELVKDMDLNVTNILKDFLTPNQISIILKKKRKTRWTNEEISIAFTLRYFSKRAYIYVRQTLNYPLPGLATLHDWARHISMKSGLLKEVLNIMKLHSQSKTELQRLVVLSFDEIKVASAYEYDQKEDEIIGKHNYMQTVMARGLFEAWKQPVFINFDTKMTKVILDEVIDSLYAVGYIVVACVSDCGGGNIGLWRELGLSIEKTFYEHSSLKIYFFADVPHLLKLIRNWLLDTGFILEDGTLILKDSLKKLIDCSDTEVSSCHKLTSLHVTCERTQRQNVLLAAQVFSNTTATALKRYLPGDKKSATDLADFVELIGMWFDILNSYSPEASTPTKRPYGGLYLKEQNAVLHRAKETFENMRCISKNSMQIFQKGAVMTTISLQKLYEDLSSKYEIKYILTHRLNQDCLENFFSQLRSRGGLHDHPSPLNALYRIRMILLGKNPGIVQRNTNVPIEKDGNYLLSTTLKKAALTKFEVNPPILEDLPGENELEQATCSSSTSSGSSSDIHVFSKPDSENDGLLYVAGYLARKFQSKYPSLGSYTYQNEPRELHTYSLPSWVQSLSFGGLTEPSDSWAKNVEIMNKYFIKYHKETFKTKKNIVKNTVKYISKKCSEVPLELIRGFVRQRVFIRVKYLNRHVQAATSKKRQASYKDCMDDDSKRKQMKKKAKFTK